MSDWVRQWLERHGLGEFADVFAEQRIERDTIPDLTDADLRELGIPLGPRKKILKAIDTGSTDNPALDIAVEANAAHVDSSAHQSAWERMPGERKPVTLLFADISGSTALTELLDAEDTHELLYGATQKMCEAVESCRGTVCRFMGDGVMAMFGAPIASEHHATNACEAAIEMQRAISNYAESVEKKHGVCLKIRVGLHSGEVVVLTVGEGDNVEYDASGPAVPIAARMEQVAASGAIYLTAATHGLAARTIDADRIAPVTVKGVSGPVSVFELRRMRSIEESIFDSNQATLVGRRVELNQLEVILDSCLEQTYGQSVLVRGEPGIGKTRLVVEFARIAESKGVRTHRGLVLPFGVGRGQDAIRALVRSLLGIDSVAPETARSEVANMTVATGAVNSDDRVHLNELLDLPHPIELVSLIDAMDRAMRADGQQRVLGSLIADRSAHQPLLLIIEDLHWADDATLTQLAALMRSVAQCAALLITTSRIEGDPLTQEWRSSSGVSAFTSLDVGPLRPEESLELIRRYIDIKDPLAGNCLERAAGNPLFLEQLLRNAHEGVDENLPDSIQSLVLARLDRLEPKDKHALQTASVLGQRFEPEVLAHLLREPSYDFQTLIKHNLLRREGTSYLFTHALIQEGVYGSLLRRQRQILHKQCADYFTSTDLTLAAEHLDHADDPGAPEVFFRAARDQASRYRLDRALQLTQRGLELAGDGSTRHQLICLSGELTRELDDVEGSKSAFVRALNEARNDLERCDAWLGLAACLRVTDDYEGALQFLERAEVVASGHGLIHQLSRIHHLRGNLFFTTGNIAGCRSEHVKAVDFARTIDAVEEEVRGLGGIADAECARGRMRSAYDAFRLCVNRCQEIGLGRVEVANSSQMANCFVYLAPAPEVLQTSREIVSATVRVGNLRAEVNGLVGICNIAVDIGDAELLRTTAERGMTIARQIQSRAWEAMVMSFVAMADYFSNHLESGREAAERAVALGADARAFVGGWTLGPLAVVTDDADQRVCALREGDDLAASGMNGEGYLQFVRYAMLACWRAELWDDLDSYSEALESYTRPEPTPWSDFMVRRGRLFVRAGRGERSETIVRELTQLSDRARQLGYHASVADIEQVMTRQLGLGSA